MDFLIAKAWIGLWLIFTLITLGYSYFSRNEPTQFMSIYLFLTFVLSHIFDNTPIKFMVYVGMDVLGLCWCFWVWREFGLTKIKDRPDYPKTNQKFRIDRSVVQWVCGLFICMLLTHYAGAKNGISYDLTLGVFYGLQLTVLILYSRQHGKAAREDPQSKYRNDILHRAMLWLNPLKITSR